MIAEQKYYDQAAANGIKVRTFENRIKRHKWDPDTASTTPTTINADRLKKKMAQLERKEAGNADRVIWTPEQIEAHLAAIGPDKNFELFYEQKKRRNGKYYTTEEAWV